MAVQNELSNQASYVQTLVPQPVSLATVLKIICKMRKIRLLVELLQGLSEIITYRVL